MALKRWRSCWFFFLDSFALESLVLCVKANQTETDKIIEAFVYSFIIYALFVAIFGLATPVTINVQDDKTSKDVKHYSMSVQAKPIFTLFGLAIAVGLLLSIDKTNNFSGCILRKIRFTHRTTRTSVWQDVFHENHGDVLVELGDGRRVMGSLHDYSDDPNEPCLFLKPAAWIDCDFELIRYQHAGIFITNNLGIRAIEFLELKTTESKGKVPSSESGDK